MICICLVTYIISHRSYFFKSFLYFFYTFFLPAALAAVTLSRSNPNEEAAILAIKALLPKCEGGSCFYNIKAKNLRTETARVSCGKLKILLKNNLQSHICSKMAVKGRGRFPRGNTLDLDGCPAGNNEAKPPEGAAVITYSREAGATAATQQTAVVVCCGGVCCGRVGKRENAEGCAAGAAAGCERSSPAASPAAVPKAFPQGGYIASSCRGGLRKEQPCRRQRERSPKQNKM